MIQKLQVAQRNCTTIGTSRFLPGDRVVITTKVNPPVGGETSIGDTTGKVILTTPKRVKIRTDSSIITHRALHNLIMTEE